MEQCSVEGCGRGRYARTWCKTHYARWARGRPVEGPIRFQAGRGFERPCDVAGCERPHYGRGYCERHYQRLRSHGDPLITKRRLNGEGTIHDGYRLCFIEGQYIAEHRLVVERLIGRELLPEETVHHRNGVRTDNRPENLELWSSRHPKGQRVADLVAWAKEMLALYEPQALAAYHGRLEAPAS